MEKKKAITLRSPIVTVLGHVDHGKTTLLDYIRNSSVQRKEAGGITQGIGASVATTKKGQKITFIDTPGHAAFTGMRSRGASVADIAILVIAANDGMKPQTKEALSFIQEAGIPFIVAVTKIDLSSVDINLVTNQLLTEGVKLESVGGDIPLLPVSGKTGQGIDDLLDMIILLSEVNDLQGDPSLPLSAVIIETNKDKRGSLVSAVVKEGTLKVGDEVVAEGRNAKIRGLFNSLGVSVKEVFPGEPVAIIGFNELPSIGSYLTKVGTEDHFQKIETKTVHSKLLEGQKGVFIKAQTAGKLEAILNNIPAGIVVLYSGIGDITENDVFLAKAARSDIYTFEIKPSPIIIKLAATEGIKIENFDIIYKLFEHFDKLLKGEESEIIGKAEILASFPFNNRKVAGSKMLSGVIKKSDKLILSRGGKELATVKVNSMKKEKRDVAEVSAGEEFGVILEGYTNFEVGDQLLSVR